MSASNSWWSSLLDFLSRLFNPPPPDAGVLAPLQSRVLLIVYNPVVDTASGRKLIDTMGWNDPEQLVAGYIQDVRECSGNLVNYQIVQRIEPDALPVKVDGYQYQTQEYVNALRAHSGFHMPNGADYNDILAKFNVLPRVTNDEIDEVWMFGGPEFCFYESRMAGRGAFFCNSEPVPNTEECPRRFVIIGFNYERGIGEMLEDLGHRAESILQYVYRFKTGDANLFQRFCLYDQIAPGGAHMGTVHFAPNSVRDYDWGNTTPVPSYCDDWDSFPNFPGDVRIVDAREWGDGDIRLHHKWWLRHLPKVAGTTDGIANFWWKYVIDPNNVR